jgi:hypothetical protein
VERRAFVLALALTLPLVIYGIPYAYAITASSSYVVGETTTTQSLAVHCKTGDYATGGGAASDSFGHLESSYPLYFDGTTYAGLLAGQPNAWGGYADQGLLTVWVVCQSPIPLPAGLGVPEFGSLYVAIALGAVVYFMLSRRFARRPTTSAQVNI